MLRIPKQATKAPQAGAAVYRLLKNEVRASINLARSYRLSGSHRLAVQFLNDASQSRRDLTSLMGAI
ncbi:hypothetical protein [Photobacterium sp. TY1-4]|uniref:hypothetical protein n=1 Tax=Photobacterium sp. TY1-4 TaxID=2899122 RepID=UPI0021BE74E2|nr:hypothetical protein [Photobacterium sp. TY1-4]UXI02760.1 hypothetical protein NH461_08370 [Photobacterium sp. TY1-4]